MNNSEIYKRLYKDYSKKYINKILISVLFGVLVAIVRNHADKTMKVAVKPERFLQTEASLTKLLDDFKKRLEARVDIVDPKEKDATINNFEKLIQKWQRIAGKYQQNELEYKRNYHESASKPGKNKVFLLKTVGDTDPPGFQGQQIPASMRNTDGSVKVYYQMPMELEDE